MAKTILIVEDETALRKAVKNKLEKEGFKIFEAANGEVGLELALDKKPDLILLDIVMPKVDGMEMLSKLRKDKWGKKVPVIVMTNLSDVKNVAEAAGEGVYDYLVKSDWKLSDIVEKVKEVLSS